MSQELLRQADEAIREGDALLERTSASAFPCPNCETPMRVLRTSGRKWHIWRRRECPKCKQRMTTKETAA
jgi:ssDNA-binding Zn-finger/Zn-ribbon topoisomerase 1